MKGTYFMVLQIRFISHLSIFYMYPNLQPQLGDQKGRGLKEIGSVCEMRVFCQLISWYLGTQPSILWKVERSLGLKLIPFILIFFSKSDQITLIKRSGWSRGWAPTLFLGQTEFWRAQQNYFPDRAPSYLRVWINCHRLLKDLTLPLIKQIN